MSYAHTPSEARRRAGPLDLFLIPVWWGIAGWFAWSGVRLGTLSAWAGSALLVVFVLAMSTAILSSWRRNTPVPRWFAGAAVGATVSAATISFLSNWM